MKKILLIEDEDVIRTSVKELLESHNFKVFSASEGKEGLQLAYEIIPDLIISDIMMPKVDGFQVLEHVQNMPVPHMVPFIFLTARVDEMDVRKGMNMGANDYLKKPFRAKELLKIVDTQLRKKEKSDRILESVYTDIAAYVPHEMRTPLVPIIGYSELIREELNSLSKEEIYDIVNKIIISGRRMHRTIEKFIKYTDIILRARNPNETGRRNFAVNSAAGLIRSISTRIADEHNREKDVELSLTESKIKIRREDFEFIVEELMNNAIKFPNSGTKILLEGQIKDRLYVFKITDHGRGIPPDRLNNINPFIQHEREIYQQTGNGLGLISVKKLTEYYGGTFEIDSILNKFTACSVSIPAYI